MSMLFWHIRKNRKLVAEGKPPADTPRYIVSHPWNTRTPRPNSKHAGAKIKPRNWRRYKRARRKAQKLARRAHR